MVKQQPIEISFSYPHMFLQFLIFSLNFYQKNTISCKNSGVKAKIQGKNSNFFGDFCWEDGFFDVFVWFGLKTWFSEAKHYK